MATKSLRQTARSGLLLGNQEPTHLFGLLNQAVVSNLNVGLYCTLTHFPTPAEHMLKYRFTELLNATGLRQHSKQWIILNHEHLINRHSQFLEV